MKRCCTPVCFLLSFCCVAVFRETLQCFVLSCEATLLFLGEQWMTDSKGEQLSAGLIHCHWSIKGSVKICNDNSTSVVIYTEQKYERNTFSFHEQYSKNWEILYVHTCVQWWDNLSTSEVRHNKMLIRHDYCPGEIQATHKRKATVKCATDAASCGEAHNWHADCRNGLQSCCQWMKCSTIGCLHPTGLTTADHVEQHVQQHVHSHQPSIHHLHLHDGLRPATPAAAAAIGLNKLSETISGLRAQVCMLVVVLGVSSCLQIGVVWGCSGEMFRWIPVFTIQGRWPMMAVALWTANTGAPVQ